MKIKRMLLQTAYRPSPQAWKFHKSTARFRSLVWGMKSGKTKAGANEFARAAMASPNRLGWIAAPTYGVLDEAVTNLMEALSEHDGIIQKRIQRELWLANGCVIQMKSAEYPNNLRGPNVDFIWTDEDAFISEDAKIILRSRIVARNGEMMATTTPIGRNHVWTEAMLAGMPSEAPYGEFEKGEHFVSHYPTWLFPWVPKDEIDALRQTMTKIRFEQEFGAIFNADSSKVFRNVDENVTWEEPPSKFECGVSIGVDLAKVQDYTAVVPMLADGRVFECDRWNDVDWSIQRPRLVAIYRKWEEKCGHVVMVIDRANIGSVIEEDLRAEGLNVFPVDLNSPDVKANVVSAMQIAFEQRRIKLLARKSNWTGEGMLKLYDELDWYQYSLTSSGRVSYSAPKKLTDDCTMALCLSNWGRYCGHVGGGGDSTGDNDAFEVNERGLRRNDYTGFRVSENGIFLKKPKAYSNIRRRSWLGQESGGFLWR